MAQTMKVRKGDVVRVLRGKDAGKEGRVIEALPKQGTRRRREHQHRQAASPPAARSRTRWAWVVGGMTPGGIIDLAAPLPVSNVMVVCPVCGKPTRVGTIEKTVKDRKVRIRVCKQCGEEIDRG